MRASESDTWLAKMANVILATDLSLERERGEGNKLNLPMIWGNTENIKNIFIQI